MADRERGTGTIVVGVDGSAPSRQALEWALRQAEYEGAEVLAVHAWQMPAIYGSGAMVLPAEAFADDTRTALAAAVKAIAAARPGVHVEQLVMEGNPAKVLIDKRRAPICWWSAVAVTADSSVR
jgi:nucleotide-binding universal stress UspA family protein